MIRRWRALFGMIACAGGITACEQILGLGDLHDRVAADLPDAANDAPSNTDAGDAGAECQHNAECIQKAQGAPAMCVTGKCVNVKEDLCVQTVLPDNATLAKDNVIVVASFLLVGTTTPTTSGPGLAYTLAMKEIQAAGGIQSQPPHELAMLICKANPDKVQDALNHVINDLKVPAILPNFGSGDLVRFIPPQVAAAGTFTMNPSVTTDALKFAQTKRLVWSLLGTGEDVARAYRPVVTRVQAEELGGAEIKVAVITTNGSLDEAMANVLQKGQRIPVGQPDAGAFDRSTALDVNGLAPTDPLAKFLRVDIDSPEVGPVDSTKLTKAKNDVIAFQPDVIIALTTSELNGVFEEIDTTLAGAGDASSSTKPIWILGPNNGRTSQNGKLTALGTYLNGGTEPDVVLARSRRKRFLGVQYAGAVDIVERDGWRGRMNMAFGADTAAGALATENFYDAVYWLAFGFAAAGADAPVEGQSFQIGVRNLITDGPKIYAGPRKTVQDSFSAIAFAHKTSFVGALGPPDIDESTGTWNSVGAVYCYPQPGEESQGFPRYDVRRYQRSDGGLVGDYPLNCN